jgi:hypothetical protein
MGTFMDLPGSKGSLCWVADPLGSHRICDSVASYNALLKKYYGMAAEQ